MYKYIILVLAIITLAHANVLPNVGNYMLIQDKAIRYNVEQVKDAHSVDECKNIVESINAKVAVYNGLTNTCSIIKTTNGKRYNMYLNEVADYITEGHVVGYEDKWYNASWWIWKHHCDAFDYNNATNKYECKLFIRCKYCTIIQKIK